VPRVLVIDEAGNKLGEFLTEDAVKLAQDRGFDLIEVAPTSRPPVCKVGDYGQLKYERKKRAAAARKNQVQVQTKEVKVRPKTDKHDMDVKVRHARRFLEAGDKVKVTVRFRGRELAHRDIGAKQCLRVFKRCEDLGLIESQPRMDGRQMFMIMAPLKRPTPPPAKSKHKADRPSTEEIERSNAAVDAEADADVTGEAEKVAAPTEPKEGAAVAEPEEGAAAAEPEEGAAAAEPKAEAATE
jgi:translation initiation factor IF-3